MNSARVATLFLVALSSMAQTVPRPAGPYFEPLLDWQYRAGILKRGIVIATGDSIIPQIANGGTPQDGGFYMIFQASNVSTTMATFQVDFFDSNGEFMNMPLPTSPDDLTGTSTRGFQGTLSPGGYGAQVTIPDGSPTAIGYAVVTMNPAESVCSQRDVLAVSSRAPAVYGRRATVERPSQDGIHAVPIRDWVHSHPGFGVAAVSGCDTDCAHRL